MTAGRTARDRVRAEITREIKEAARARLAESGAHALSLRAVARDLGMVSSALYRYFPSRDDLLTALIIDAYDALGARVEQAAASGAPRVRWHAACAAVRAWAREHPHEYALVYGSPVPGYEAPQTTIPSASRVPLTLIAIVRDAPELTPTPAPPLPPDLAAQAARTTALVAPDLPDDVMVRVAAAWAHLYGLIGFELFGHLANTFDPADALFAWTVETMADTLGLP
ncbi:TetR/AcrR family transcriptional regulator [Actinomadura flavalba]|uniref:TetR/AcrR family transcriptional regulator n=1 Tax=Actinomadura flavalba TaxID=1120938 RepID=UPI000372E9F2|nr:TetR/AcrR family transcriptional regulator [Actinomadura flavalba]